MVVLVFGTYFIATSVSFEISEDKDIIIIGDSHTECAIDDNIFLRAVNISQSGNSYLYSYVKLRKFIDANPQVNNVLLSFHGGSITKSRDEWIIGNKCILSHVPNHFSLFHREEVLLLINKPGFISAILKSPLKSIKAVLNLLTKKKTTYKDLIIGGYLKLDRDKLEEDNERHKNSGETQVEKTLFEYSQYELNYLLKIVELCHAKNVELILFNSPTYNSEKFGNKFALMDFYNKYFSEIKYLDFSDFDIPEYGYGDIGHLNYKGAEIFSRYLGDNYELIFGK